MSSKRKCTVAKQQMLEIQSSSSNASKAELRTKYGVRETNNPLFDLGFDLYKYGRI